MPKSKFVFDLELDKNGILHELCGLPLYWWTVKDLKKVEKESGGSVRSRSLKIEVCRRLHDVIPCAFENTRYEPMTREDIEEKRAEAKVASERAVLKMNSQGALEEQRRQPQMTALLTIVRKHQASAITNNRFDADDTDAAIYTVGARSTRSGASHHHEANREVERLFFNRVFSSQHPIEPAPRPLGFRRRQLHTEPVPRPHYGVELDILPEWRPMRNRQTEQVLMPHSQAESVLRNRAQVGPSQADAMHASALLSCEVCFDDITTTNRLPRSISTTCTHEKDVICRPCLEQHITSQVASRNWDSVTCPQVGCEAVLSHADLHTFASAEIFERYDTSISRRVVEADPDFVPCSNPRCSGGGLIDAQSGLFFECTYCNTITCLKCKTADNPGLFTRPEPAEYRVPHHTYGFKQARGRTGNTGADQEDCEALSECAVWCEHAEGRRLRPYDLQSLSSRVLLGLHDRLGRN
jgi:hypothetical protein